METHSMNAAVCNDPRVPTLRMAGAAGVAVASIYYNQPMLGQIASEFSGSSLTGLIPTVTQLGYALGLIFLVPLGDLIERRRLIVMRFGLLAFALAATAGAYQGFPDFVKGTRPAY